MFIFCPCCCIHTPVAYFCKRVVFQLKLEITCYRNLHYYCYNICERHWKMGHRSDDQVESSPSKTFPEVWQQKKSHDARRVRQKFNVLAHEILLHEYGLMSRCIIMKKFDSTHASVRSGSLALVKMMDLNKHVQQGLRWNMFFSGTGKHACDVNLKQNITLLT